MHIQPVGHDQMIVTQSILPETVYKYKTLLYDFTGFIPLERQVEDKTRQVIKGLDSLSQFYGQKV